MLENVYSKRWKEYFDEIVNEEDKNENEEEHKEHQTDNAEPTKMK